MGSLVVVAMVLFPSIVQSIYIYKRIADDNLTSISQCIASNEILISFECRDESIFQSRFIDLREH